MQSDLISQVNKTLNSVLVDSGVTQAKTCNWLSEGPLGGAWRIIRGLEAEAADTLWFLPITFLAAEC